MRVWISVYALTKGIQEIEAETCGDDMISYKVPDYTVTIYFLGEGDEWHRTRKSAIAKAEAMRVTKIASLEKQIAKLRKMTFE